MASRCTDSCLEETQAKNDKLNSGKAKAVKKGPSAADIKKQRAIAAAAAAEKKRLDNDRKKKAKADKNAKAAAAKKSDADRRAKQEAEKQRRLAANKAQKNQNKAAADLAQKQKLNKQLAQAEAEKARLEALANAPSAAPKVAIATTVAKETSSPIASYPLAQDKIDNRDRGISDDLAPICEAIIDNDASVVLHTNTKADYRWLTVRLTLCTRRLDSSFRLRYSFQEVSNEGPFMTLHPARNSALIGSTLD
jgi:colicin import membrane protein